MNLAVIYRVTLLIFVITGYNSTNGIDSEKLLGVTDFTKPS